jgi:hypothetical protein
VSRPLRESGDDRRPVDAEVAARRRAAIIKQRVDLTPIVDTHEHLIEKNCFIKENIDSRQTMSASDPS